jgi:hypothetical protein
VVKLALAGAVQPRRVLAGVNRSTGPVPPSLVSRTSIIPPCRRCSTQLCASSLAVALIHGVVSCVLT